MKIFKNWFSKPAKETPSFEQKESKVDAVAYFNIGVSQDGEVVISSDFLDGHEAAISELMFLLCSGALMEIVGQIITERCGDDQEQRDLILSNAYNRILENLNEMVSENEDDDEPVVDPCFVFRSGIEEEEEDD